MAYEHTPNRTNLGNNLKHLKQLVGPQPDASAAAIMLMMEKDNITELLLQKMGSAPSEYFYSLQGNQGDQFSFNDDRECESSLNLRLRLKNMQEKLDV